MAETYTDSKDSKEHRNNWVASNSEPEKMLEENNSLRGDLQAAKELISKQTLQIEELQHNQHRE